MKANIVNQVLYIFLFSFQKPFYPYVRFSRVIHFLPHAVFVECSDIWLLQALASITNHYAGAQALERLRLLIYIFLLFRRQQKKVPKYNAFRFSLRDVLIYLSITKLMLDFYSIPVYTIVYTQTIPQGGLYVHSGFLQ